MDALNLWKQKLIQLLHDPPGKPFVLYPGAGGHEKVAKELFAAAMKCPLNWVRGEPDWAAAGADRAVLPALGKGSSSDFWVKNPLIAHPLAEGGAWLDLRPNNKEKLDKRLIQAEVVQQPLELMAPEDDRSPLAEFEWQDLESLRQGYSILWRRFREALMESGSHFPLLWGEMPAETRQPDHSIWDHTRMTAALAFLRTRSATRARFDPEDAQTPWLMRLALSPVQAFIQEARTSRDLWVGSFLLSDLAWHAMEPIVEHYGPDAILYPDLRGNPMADHFLLRRELFGLTPEQLLGDQQKGREAASFAALLPASFVALVPRGGQGDLEELEALGRQCQRRVDERWSALARQVHDWLVDPERVGPGPWQAIWARQQKQPPVRLRWTAVPWLPPRAISKAEVLEGGPALPASTKKRPQLSEQDERAISERRQYLRPWVPPKVWSHYELARLVFARTNLPYINNERGFDYPLAYHQLLARDALVKQQPPAGGLEASDEPGEKCTLCGRRQALTKGATEASLDGQRDATRKFWSNEELDPEKSGADRLCAICATRRFLVPAGAKGQRLTGINPDWAGLGVSFQEVADGGKARVRVPFPSTATVAAQKFIEAVVEEEALTPYLKEVVAAHKGAKLVATTFPRALPRLAAVAERQGKGSTGWQFLIREAEETLFPEAMESLRQLRARGRKDSKRPEALERLVSAITKLRQEAKDLAKEQNRPELLGPGNRFAVVKIDGDRMGRLFLGDPEAIGAKWEDVIHPDFRSWLIGQDRKEQWGWSDLLLAKRHQGPALHAFITRALAEFQHRVVPWVVEREFSGRLIYSGGDDILCLVPADEALDLAARLQQLFSAPWVIDTQPDAAAWKWRFPNGEFEYDQRKARRRFLPLKPGTEEAPLRAPFADQVELHPADGQVGQFQDDRFRVLPMLGKGQSLSAGIAFGHYKTPMGVMLREAGQLLDEWAKEKAGRGAVALGHFTRGGAKSRFAMQWGQKADWALKETIEGFRQGRLPGRLPYRLRELAPTLQVLEGAQRRQLAEVLFERAVGDGGDGSEEAKKAQKAARAVWLAGVDRMGTQAESTVAGLLVCRALASGSEEEG